MVVMTTDQVNAFFPIRNAFVITELSSLPHRAAIIAVDAVWTIYNNVYSDPDRARPFCYTRCPSRCSPEGKPPFLYGMDSSTNGVDESSRTGRRENYCVGFDINACVVSPLVTPGVWAVVEACSPVDTGATVTGV